jgi:hypothetical protein
VPQGQRCRFRGTRRLDAMSRYHAIEVEMGGTPQKIIQALSRLKTQRNRNKILRVPQMDRDIAVQQVRNKTMTVTVGNLYKTKRKKA